MRHVIRHDLTPEQLRLAVQRFADVYCQRFSEYGTTTEWTSQDRVEVRFKVKGIKLAGSLELLPREIGIDMDVPLPLRLFKSRAVAAIEEEVTPWLAKAKNGELG
ncbi:MAG: polyhydroxyalkanoic acid system family protein [Myxococcales bacterium]